MALISKTKVFVSFDYDHDRALKNLLVGQARNSGSPFFIEDHSIKVETKNWKADARKRIRRCDVVIVICGLHTHRATGVTEEVNLARQGDVPYYLLKGCSEGLVRRPRGTSWYFDTIHPWTWNELKSMTTVRQASRRSPLW